MCFWIFFIRPAVNFFQIFFFTYGLKRTFSLLLPQNNDLHEIKGSVALQRVHEEVWCRNE